MYRKLPTLRRAASSVSNPALSLALNPWETTPEQAEDWVHKVEDTAAALLKSGEGGVVQCIGAKSVIAALKGLALAEGQVSGEGERTQPWGQAARVKVVAEKAPRDFHTFALHFTDATVEFPAQSRLVDVLDKSELQRDVIQWAKTSPSDFYDESVRNLDFDRNSPEWSKPYALNVQELLDSLAAHRNGECILRGMGPTLFNALQVISAAQDAAGVALPFGLMPLQADAGSIAIFKDNVKGYFERGMVHFADGDSLPGLRHDGKVLTPPKGFTDEDHFLCGFAPRLDKAALLKAL
eukprot:TRINITY_DN25052_c0_g1_i1.p1 TRINITY_DN25052_c0_g1~~TRINITY_DN25052_c0_g1_i1.p1  ORF type:complete len:295 (+),score=119.47 TRINITY_DN25052_c0_g1_i1:91-975(+)